MNMSEMNISKLLADELGIKVSQVEATIKLIDEGNTIPFIARYRKEVTGNLSDDVLRELVKELKVLEKNGKIDLSKPFDLRRNSNVYQALKRYETLQLRRLTEYYWIGY